jgi:hypothetical protein
MWGNDPEATTQTRDEFAVLQETQLNQDLAGVVWRGPNQVWDERPWPGFQGRLNGPADNLRSSCMSCHALAQWPRSRVLSIVPSSTKYSLANLSDKSVRDDLRTKYLTNVVGGTLTIPAEVNPGTDWGGAVALDYSLQLEAAFTRLCRACKEGALQGATPRVCKVKGQRDFIETATCPNAILFQTDIDGALLQDPPPRQ